MVQKTYFNNLDSLRTIACLFVLSEHVFWKAFTFLDIDSPITFHFLYVLFGNGKLGVSVFFTLSGFLITYLILKEIETKGRIDIKSFYIRRSLRIWPLYFVLLIFVFFIYPLIQYLMHIDLVNPANKIYYFTFLSNFDVINLSARGIESFLQSSITWSIGIEEQFYLLWPLLFLIVPRKKFIYIFLAVILVSIIFRYCHHTEKVVLYFHTLGVCSDLAIGGLAAYLIIASQKFRDFFVNMTTKWRVSIYSLGFLYLLLADYSLNFEYATVFKQSISACFYAFIILQQCFDEKSPFKLGSIKIFSNWGKYTYGLYLLHPIGVLIYEIMRSHYNFNDEAFLPGIMKGFAVLIVTCIISFLSYKIIEQPFLKLKNKFSSI